MIQSTASAGAVVGDDSFVLSTFWTDVVVKWSTPTGTNATAGVQTAIYCGYDFK